MCLLTAISFQLVAQTPAGKDQKELEREKLQLKRELEQTQELLDKNKKLTKDNIAQWSLINRKLDLQGNIIQNINQDINRLDNNIYKSQRDVNKLGRLLDTLKKEYAKSMVYSYKNRNNSDFLSFIFSASSFNDAIKRISYLKSYRNFREIQGENILRTQELQRNRIQELNGHKIEKSVVLQTQSKELDVLKVQEEEKTQLVNKLKAQGKELNNQIAAKKKQMQKVNNAIAAAIKKAVDDARKAAAAKAAEDKRIRDAEEKALAAKNKSANTEPATPAKTNKPVKTKPVAEKPTVDLLPTAADVTLNANFENNRGSLPWPVGSGYIIMHKGLNKLPNNAVIESDGITIGTDIGSSVKAVFDGEVISINNIDDMQMVMIKHGRYFSTYINLSSVSIAKGQSIRTGQTIGKVAANLDGIGSIDLYISNDKNNLDPEVWLRRH